MTKNPLTQVDVELSALSMSDVTRRRKQRTNVFPHDINLAKKFFPISDGKIVHEKILKQATKRASDELTQWADWINKQCENDKIKFVLCFDDDLDFNASIEPPLTLNGEFREHPIYIVLGCVPVIMSVANRISQLLDDDTTASFFGMEPYNPIYGPMGTLTYDSGDGRPDFERTIRIAIDAITLIFLHEVTHGCRAHQFFPEFFKNVYRKAMESDADWGSGYMFVQGLLAGLSPRNGNSLSIGRSELAERLAFASQTTLLGFQSTRDPSKSESIYHLPYTRSRCIVFGAKLAWEESRALGPDFFDAFYDVLAKMCMFDEIFHRTWAGWIGHAEKQSQDDWFIHDYFTVARLAEIHTALAHMEGGPIKALRPAYPLTPTLRKSEPLRCTPTLPFKLSVLTQQLFKALQLGS